MSIFWKDTMDIYRYVDEVVNGVTKNKKVLLSDSVKCHYSKKSLNALNSSGIPDIVTTHVIFCSIETDIKEGDYVEVTLRNGRKVSLTIGECFPYSNKYECLVKRNDKA